MKRTYFKTLIIGLLCSLIFAAVLFTVAGCSSGKNVKYNAVLYDDAAEWLREDFKADNNIDYDQDGNINRTFLVDSQEEYNSIFIENADGLSVDFDSQTLAVYTYIAVNYRNNYLTSTEVRDGVLTITYEMEDKPGICDTCVPYQRWFVVRLDKLEVDGVVFNRK